MNVESVLLFYYTTLSPRFNKEIDQMNPDNQVIVVAFNGLITKLRPIGAVGESEGLARAHWKGISAIRATPP
jgi:hypothetical protein